MKCTNPDLIRTQELDALETIADLRRLDPWGHEARAREIRARESAQREQQQHGEGGK